LKSSKILTINSEWQKLKKMDKIIDEKEAIRRLSNICAKQEKSPNDILKKLRTWGFNSNDSKQILEKLQGSNFINDLRFASAYVNDKLKFNKWGKKKLAYMLSQNGIHSSVIADAIDSINQEDYEAIISEELRKKAKTIKSSNKREQEIKLMKFAESRGYEFEICRRLISL